eukprot:gene23782-9342_t
MAMHQAYSPASSFFSKRIGTTVSTNSGSARPSTSSSSRPSRQNLGHGMERGEYDELIYQQQQAEGQKREDRENLVHAMLTTQAEEFATLEATHSHQFELFTANSDSLLEGVRKKCQRSEDALLSKHGNEAVAWDNSTGIDSMKIRASKDLMDVRRMEEKALRNEDFIGADKSHMHNWMIKRDLEETKMLQRQAKELKATRLRNSSVTTEAVLQQERELEKLQKRLAAAKLALSRQHSKERQMLEQSLNGNHMGQRASFARQQYSAPGQATSSGSTYSTSRGSSARASGYSLPGGRDMNRRARPMTSPHAGRSRRQDTEIRPGAPGGVRETSSPGFVQQGSHSREAWPKSGDGGSAEYADAYAESLPTRGSGLPTTSQSYERSNSQVEPHEEQAAGGGGGFDDAGQGGRTGGRPLANTIHSDNYIGPRAVNLDRSLMPRGVFERMQEAKDQQERAKKAERLSGRGGQSARDSLTARNLQAHEHANSGGSKASSEMRHSGNAPPTPSGFESNCNHAGSGIRPLTAGPPPLRTF